MLKDKIPGSAGGSGVNVELITGGPGGLSVSDKNPPVKNTSNEGVGNGNWIYNEGGHDFWPKKNTGLPAGNKIRGDIASHTIR